MLVSARSQAGQALEVVARAGEEEVVDGVCDRERERSTDGGRDRPLRPVACLVGGEVNHFLVADVV